MSCGQLQEFLDGRLAPTARMAFEAHTEACDSCSQELEAWRAFEVAARDWGQLQPEPTAAQTTRLISRAAAPKSVGGMWVTVALAAAAVFLLVLGWPDATLEPTPAPPLVQVPPSAPAGLTPEPVFAAGVGTTVSVEALVAGPEGRLVADLGPDRVALAADTHVRLETTTNAQVHLVLEAGLAAFDVSPRPPDLPFTVQAGDVRVSVIGTRFSVDRTGALRVEVAEGTVEVADGSGRWKVRAGETFEAGLVLPAEGLGERLTELLHPGPLAPPPVPEPAAVVAPTRSQPHQQPDLAALRSRVAAGDLDQALPALRALVADSPDDVVAWRLLAVAEAKAGDSTAAVLAWQEVSVRGSGAQARRAHFEAAVLLQDLGEHGSAVVHLQAWLGDPAGSATLTAEARLRLAESMLALGRTLEARSELNRVVDEHPGSTSSARAAQHLAELGP